MGRMELVHVVVGSPMGPVVVAAQDVADGAVTHVRLPRADGSAADDALGGRVEPHAHPALAHAARELDEYFAGERRDFTMPLHPAGTAFQRLVWDGLRRIPYGTTTTYGALAAALGLDPRTTSRAVGAANGANPVAVVVPCHRVIGADGTLTGFAAGIGRKRALLDLEAAVASGTTVLF